MRILFVDIDGVMHPVGCDVDALFMWRGVLDELLAEHGDVALVVSSTWRYEYSLVELRELLGPRVADSTPRGPRWDSIQWWMSQNYRMVQNWRVLDDAPQEFPDSPPLELIVCDSLTGLSDAGVQVQLRAWLEGDRQ